MRLPVRVVAALAGVAILSSPVAGQEAAHPVKIGQDGPEMDACGGIGKAARLAGAERSYLSVHTAPQKEAGEIARLPNGFLFWLCDAEGRWQGIVFPAGKFQELGDCRVSIPVPSPEAYAGPCQQGWVDARFVDLVAG